MVGAALLLGTGCATAARSPMGATLDYLRAVEGADPALYERTLSPGFEYVSPRPGSSREPLVLKAETDLAGFRALATFNSPRLSSVRVEEREDGTLDVYFRMKVGHLREKTGSGGEFALEGRWRVTVSSKDGVPQLTRVEEFPTRSTAASFAVVKTLHAGIQRPIAAGGCQPAPCAGREYLDPAGRVLVQEVWKLAPDGSTVVGSVRFLDPEGKPFSNHSR